MASTLHDPRAFARSPRVRCGPGDDDDDDATPIGDPDDDDDYGDDDDDDEEEDEDTLWAVHMRERSVAISTIG